MIVLLESIAKELRNDTRFCDDIVDDPEMLGVSETGDSTMTIKLGVKTVPIKKQTIKCELMYQIKRKLDTMNIEPPASEEEPASGEESEESDAALV